MSFGQHDVYLNVAGRHENREPAGRRPLPPLRRSSRLPTISRFPADAIYFGEISLSGAERASPHMGQRLKEAQKLGFTEAVIPQAAGKRWTGAVFPLRRITHLKSCREPWGMRLNGLGSLPSRLNTTPNETEEPRV